MLALVQGGHPTNKKAPDAFARPMPFYRLLNETLAQAVGLTGFGSRSSRIRADLPERWRK
jgi:hypothetical protein